MRAFHLINSLGPTANEFETTHREARRKGTSDCNVKLEFYEPPAVPGFGAAGGFSLNLLDKTNSGDYEQMGK